MLTKFILHTGGLHIQLHKCICINTFSEYFLLLQAHTVYTKHMYLSTLQETLTNVNPLCGDIKVHKHKPNNFLSL